ncbi:MAG: aspartate carbamoyltransferase [Bacteroidetes bacterium]|jgi:aspartate carbamoyltransferase catalytic subunit|nr:aspartate carbamoyltransferase [Bacteroidota bacterium]
MKLSHVIESQQFTVPLIHELFARARQMEATVRHGGTRDYERRIMATLFYGSSTRTRFSFEAAMQRLGGRVLSTESAQDFSSEIPGEHLEDTIRIIGGMCDLIVLRSRERDGAKRAAAISPVPVINAGDGEGGQHPTQALLDLYTIQQECRTVNGLTVVFMGALDAGRTVRSLAYLLGKVERNRLIFVAPPEVQIAKDILRYLDDHGVRYELTSDPAKVLPQADVVYQTRIDPDRLRSLDVKPAAYNLDLETLARLKPSSVLLHPLPRSVEIDPAVDQDPRAAYFRQARNGLFVRMALLTMLLEP